MPFVFKRLALLLSIAAAFAADKQTPFQVGPAASFANHQTNDKVTMGADPYVVGEKVKVAFGKVDPYQYGILPVLVVIQNDSNAAIKLNGMHAEYVGPNGDRVDATPAREVRYAKGPRRPGVIGGPAGAAPKILGKKNPLDAWEIEGRAFAAQMLIPGQSASGFLYFETGLQRGATIYIRGMRDAATDNELIFFELPLSSDSPEPAPKK
jgi:hypothetical protein